MIKPIILLEFILKKKVKILVYLFFQFFIFNNCVIASEKWVVDKKISEISFEVPVLFASNVKGFFSKFDGFVQIDTNKKLNNKAIFSVSINSINTNYDKYKNLLLSSIFFDSQKYPLSVLDTNNFSYKNNRKIVIDIQLMIKGKTKKIPLELNIKKLTDDLVQVKGDLVFQRSDFDIGIGKWKNTTFLKNKVKLSYNIFLFKE